MDPELFLVFLDERIHIVDVVVERWRRLEEELLLKTGRLGDGVLECLVHSLARGEECLHVDLEEDGFQHLLRVENSVARHAGRHVDVEVFVCGQR